MVGPVRRVGRIALIVLELALLTALIVATRCANYQDVFVAGNVYFVDADCYARMTRVQMVRANPGLIIRHHVFENFPQGTTPHTTAPLDYLIAGLSFLLNPFTVHPLDLAGAVVSPLLALTGGWFLWWWSRRMQFRYRGAMLVLYAISPILVQGSQLGRPDHQSLAMLLVTVAICAEWTLQDTRAASHAIRDPGMAYRLRTWSAVSGVTWAMAIWISAYEPLLLFLVVIVISFVTGIVSGPLQDRHRHLVKHRRIGWILFALIIAIALLIERRIPSLSIFQSQETFKNWARTIGELAHVSPANPIWLRWAGYMLAVMPMLFWFWLRERKNEARPLFISVLLVATYCLTLWQARWGYFFMLIFVIALPILLEAIKSRTAVWVAFMLSIFPILRDWDKRLWP